MAFVLMRMVAAFVLTFGSVLAQAPLADWKVSGESSLAFDRFGESVDVSGEWLVVSSLGLDGVSPNGGGKCEVYRRSEAGWDLHQILRSPSPTALLFGSDLLIKGDLLVIADGLDTWVDGQINGGRTGLVFVYRLVADQWALDQVMPPPLIPDSQLNFGRALAFDGQQLAISAAADSSNDWGIANGRIYVYSQSTNGFSLESVLTPEDRFGPGFELAFQPIGVRIAIEDDILVSWGGPSRLLIFRRMGSSWAFERAVESVNTSGYTFASSLAYGDGHLLVGRVGDPCGPARIGQVDCYRLDSTGLSAAQTVSASNASFGVCGSDDFGSSISYEDGRILVGARYGLNQVARPSGQAYLFSYSATGGWQEDAIVSGSTVDVTTEFMEFGHSVALEHGVAVAGAPIATGADLSVSSGSAFCFDLPVGEALCVGSPNSVGQLGAQLRVGGVDVTSSSVLSLELSGVAPFTQSICLMASESGLSPVFDGVLCLGGEVVRLRCTFRQADAAGCSLVMLAVEDAFGPAFVGQELHFQSWYRDRNPLPTSNFSGSVRVTLR